MDMKTWQVMAITNSVDVDTPGYEPIYDSIEILAFTSMGAIQLARNYKGKAWSSIPPTYVSANLIGPASSQTGSLVLRYRNGTSKNISWAEQDSQGIFGCPEAVMGLDVADIVKVTASGEFLKQIRSQFFGLPDCLTRDESGNVVGEREGPISWYCDDAKFIVGNLKID